MNLVIDVGNTRVKAALFEGVNNILRVSFLKEVFQEEINQIFERYSPAKVMISTTGKLNRKNVKFLQGKVDFLEVSSKMKLPFKNNYKTPETLGADRYALMAAAALNYPNQNVLVIDTGTCITYDFLNEYNQYKGGAISPGIQTRYKSLNDLTANLPLLEKEPINLVVGRSTNESIHSGIINGVVNEIDGVIEYYKSLTPHLTVILTGGDTNFLANRLKNTIFATSNFLLEGLNFLLEINVSK
ncbi:MAG: type III pantothenate kinase [Flavobacteriaceae bacterium]|nr:type III pantothenate kinase [Flavobacteriaceae bacterium]